MSELIYTETENIAVRTLKRQLQFEVEIARDRDDLFSYSLGALALLRANSRVHMDHDYIHTKFRTARDELNLGNLEILDIEFITGIILAFRLLSELKKVREEEKQIIESVFNEIMHRNWLNSVDLASYTLFALDGQNFDNVTNNAKSYLLNALEKSSKLRKLTPRTISALFGLSFTEIKLEDLIKDFDFSQIDKLNLRDLAKLGISLRKCGSFKEELNKIAQRIEDLVYAEFYEKESFKIREGIRDAISLIASGLNEEELNHLLELSNLSDLIEVKSQSIILKPATIEQANPTDLPSIDPEAHALALLLLVSTGREKVYVMDRSSLDIAIKGVNALKRGYIPIKKSQITPIKYILPLLILALTTLIELIIGVSWKDLLTVLDLLSKRDYLALIYKTPKISLSALILIIGICSTILSFRLLDRLINKGSIDKLTIITNTPLIGRLYKMIKGEDSK